MAEYIERAAAVCIANYAADEHPYSKERDKPETYSDYNQGWNDACDYIEGRLESMESPDVAPIIHAKWEMRPSGENGSGEVKAFCSHCGKPNKQYKPPFCPHCSARMDEVNTDE